MVLDLDPLPGFTTREHLQRRMAKIYSAFLAERLVLMPDIVMPEPAADEDCSTKHLLWMAGQVRDNYNSENWSATKLHRWIGYIQGVMVQRKLTTVQRERDDYRAAKQKMLADLKQPTTTDI